MTDNFSNVMGKQKEPTAKELAAFTQDIKDNASIENWFTYHPPKGNQQQRYVDLRQEAGKLARAIVSMVPPGADRTVALRKLRECIMTANAGIACDDNEDGMR